MNRTLIIGMVGLCALSGTYLNKATAQIPDAPPEIHCKHFIYGYPLGTPASNDLIIRNIYALSSNDERKFADWVAYRLDEKTIEKRFETNR